MLASLPLPHHLSRLPLLLILTLGRMEADLLVLEERALALVWRLEERAHLVLALRVKGRKRLAMLPQQRQVDQKEKGKGVVVNRVVSPVVARVRGRRR